MISRTKVASGLLVLLALFSTLSLVPAPRLWIWYLAIPATEYGWLGIGLLAAILAWSWKDPRFRILRLALALMGILGFGLPMAQAYRIGWRLPLDLEKAFGALGKGTVLPHPPYSWIRSLDLIPPAPRPQVWIYDSLQALSLDYYPADPGFPGPRPWVMAVHGGSWKGGNSRQLNPLYGQIQSFGYGVVALNYRLAPEHPFPATREDLQLALDFVKQKSKEWGLDSGAYFLLGRSAGAQIALLEAYSRSESGLRGVISYYGPADMIWGYRNPARVYNSVDVLETYLGGALSALPGLYAESSPILFAGPESPPTLLLHGQNDVLVAWEHSQRLEKVLGESGVPVYALMLPWATHGADFAFKGPFYQLSTYTVLFFLGRFSP